MVEILRDFDDEFPKASWISLEGSLRGFQNNSDMVEILRDLDEVQQGASWVSLEEFQKSFRSIIIQSQTTVVSGPGLI